MVLDDVDDALTFIDDDAPAPSVQRLPPWKALIVDDEADIHRVTQFVLGDFQFRGRGIEMVSAKSAAEAKRLIAVHGDFAVTLLDVVMETEDAGLQLVDHIRTELGNSLLRIILRTGQPGLAPERSVIVKYDINDYKSKVELTADRLFTTLVAALRSYEDLLTIETSRRGLEKVITASSSLFEVHSLNQFLSGILQQINALLEIGQHSLLCVRGNNLAATPDPRIFVRAGTGRFASQVDLELHDIDADVRAAIDWAFETGRNGYFANHCAVFFQARGDMTTVVYLEGRRDLTEMDKQLIDLFCAKASIAFDNVLLYEQLESAQEATVIALAKLAEFKDMDTGGHLRRVEAMTNEIVAELDRRSAFAGEIDAVLIEKIGMASILHDVGKVAVPDEVLTKPGKLTDSEWTIMQRHALIGSLILAEASKKVRGRSFLSLGAEIAEAHHERFDGTGYPNGLSGRQIPLSARIVAVADVYDALTSRRSYKEPWPREEALEWISRNAGTHFDPLVVDAFLALMARASAEAQPALV